MAGLDTTHDRPYAATRTRAAAATNRLGRFLASAVAPFRALARVADRIDESAARRARESQGKQGRLLSWRRGPDGLWYARLSGPEAPRTVERSARSRLGAIELADRALGRYRALRDELGPRPGRSPDEDHDAHDPVAGEPDWT